jgi:hypothetical protein
MTGPKLSLLPWLRSSTGGLVLLWALACGLMVVGYVVGQVVTALVLFFTFGSGAGHQNAELLVEAGCLALQIGLISWLFWRLLRRATWWLVAVNAGVSIGLFAYYAVYPWFISPPDPTYQTYTFARGAQHYEISLEQPANRFDVLAVTPEELTPQQSATTTSTSLMRGDYEVRHDTIFLRERPGGRQCFLYHQTLVGFENNVAPIPLGTRQ